MHLLHSYTHFDLDHSCSILHKSRNSYVIFVYRRERDGGTTTKLYGAHYQTVGCNNPADGSEKPRRKPILVNNLGQTTPLYY